MLGTGGSAALAIKVLKEKGVDVSNIVFLNVVGCAEGNLSIILLLGLKKLYLEYPNLRIITA
jgi:uracil phosphoribosyltransferase